MPAAHHVLFVFAVIFTANEEPVTVMMTKSLAVQPLASLTVTVYGVVEPMLFTIGFDESADERPAAGAHL